MRIVLLGATGLAGSELSPRLAQLGDVVAPGRAAVDLAGGDVETALLALAPDVVVNAAAQADVDRAEREPTLTGVVNRDAVAAIGRAAARCGAPVVHLSTDYVFDGEATHAYRETDAPRPLGVYGRTKLEGERELLATDACAVVLRTAWLIGRPPRSFVGRMLELAASRDVLQVADDQVSSPTPVFELARVVTEVVTRLVASGDDERATLRGVFHAAGAGRASRVELVRAALEASPHRAALRAREVVPVPADHFPRAAPRPRHTPLDVTKLRDVFGVTLSPWREGLAAALASYG